MAIRAYKFDHDYMFTSQGQLMTRLPSGDVMLSGGKPGDVELTLHRLGAEYIGELHDETFVPSKFDSLCERVREIESGPGEPVRD